MQRLPWFIGNTLRSNLLACSGASCQGPGGGQRSTFNFGNISRLGSTPPGRLEPGGAIRDETRTTQKHICRRPHALASSGVTGWRRTDLDSSLSLPLRQPNLSFSATGHTCQGENGCAFDKGSAVLKQSCTKAARPQSLKFQPTDAGKGEDLAALIPYLILRRSRSGISLPSKHTRTRTHTHLPLHYGTALCSPLLTVRTCRAEYLLALHREWGVSFRPGSSQVLANCRNKSKICVSSRVLAGWSVSKRVWIIQELYV